MPEKKRPIDERIEVNDLKRSTGVRLFIEEQLNCTRMSGKNTEIRAFISGSGSGRITMTGFDGIWFHEIPHKDLQTRDTFPYLVPYS